jgi:hypothetical protein
MLGGRRRQRAGDRGSRCRGRHHRRARRALPRLRRRPDRHDRQSVDVAVELLRGPSRRHARSRRVARSRWRRIGGPGRRADDSSWPSISRPRDCDHDQARRQRDGPKSTIRAQAVPRSPDECTRPRLKISDHESRHDSGTKGVHPPVWSRSRSARVGLRIGIIVRERGFNPRAVMGGVKMRRHVDFARPIQRHDVVRTTRRHDGAGTTR